MLRHVRITKKLRSERTPTSSSSARTHSVAFARGRTQRKLATELKIRDAAQTLARLNAANSSPSQISRQSSSTLETAERKVAAAQTGLWHLQERAANIVRRLFEYREKTIDVCAAVIRALSSVSRSNL
jgi:hypothetical protein